MVRSLFLVSLVCLGVAAAPWHNDHVKDNLVVTTPLFTVQGAVSDNSSLVRVFKGVPFAEKPLGALRWRPPVTKKPQAGIIDATQYQTICPIWNQGGASVYTEYITGDEPYPYLKQSEDCLYVNIWTPLNATSDSNLTVMIWIHGGGNTGGNAAQPYKEGSFLAQNQNVIVVSLDYRLNVFGYPGHAPALGSRNINVGQLDIRKAVEWTSTYIKFFGGNPESMILFGQSSGGQNTDFYSYAWATDPLVKGFITESGLAAPFGGGDLTGANWTYVTNYFNCSSGNADQQFACMQQVPWESLIDLSYSYNATLNGGLSLAFTPQIDNQTILPDYPSLRQRKQYAQGGYLTGNNANERESLLTPFSVTSGPNQTAVLLGTDQGFNCPNNASATERSDNGTPQWRYYYRGVWPNQDPFSWLGSYHSSEIPQVWGTADIRGPNTPEEAAFSAYIQTAWATFAKDPINGLSTLGWPRYNDSEDTLVQLAYQGSTLPQYVNHLVADENCTLPGHTEPGT